MKKVLFPALVVIVAVLTIPLSDIGAYVVGLAIACALWLGALWRFRLAKAG